MLEKDGRFQGSLQIYQLVILIEKQKYKSAKIRTQVEQLTRPSKPLLRKPIWDLHHVGCQAFCP